MATYPTGTLVCWDGDRFIFLNAATGEAVGSIADPVAVGGGGGLWQLDNGKIVTAGDHGQLRVYDSQLAGVLASTTFGSSGYGNMCAVGNNIFTGRNATATKYSDALAVLATVTVPSPAEMIGVSPDGTIAYTSEDSDTVYETPFGGSPSTFKTEAESIVTDPNTVMTLADGAVVVAWIGAYSSGPVDNTIRCYEPDGSMRWETLIPSPSDGMFTVCMWRDLAGDVVYVAAGHNEDGGTVSFFALDTADGTPTHLFDKVALADDGFGYFGLSGMILRESLIVADPTFSSGLELELNGPGGGWTNVEADVVNDPIEVEYGIDGSDPTDRVASTGSLSFTLDNSDSRYSPFHAAKRVGIDWGIGARYSMSLGATTRYKHVGKLDMILPVPGIERERVTRFKSLDWMDDAARADLPDFAAQTGKRGDELLAMILDAMDNPPTARDIDTWVDTFNFAFDGGSGQGLKVLQEGNKLAASEQGRIYIKGDALTGGVLRGEKRGAQAFAGGPAALSLTDDVFSDAACMANLIMAGSRDDVYSTVRVVVHPTRVDSSPTTVLFDLQSAAVLVPAGATIDTIFGPYRDPATNDACGGVDMQTPDSGLGDYAMNTAQDGSGTDVTADFTVTASYTGQGVRYTAITNTGGVDAYVITLKARGKGVYRTDAKVEKTVPNSYGTRTLEIDMPYQSSINVATFVATYLAELLGTPAARVRGVTFFASANATMLEAAIVLEVGDRIDITESVTGLSAARFIVQKLRYQNHPDGRVYVTANLVPWGLDAFWTGPGGASAIDAIGGVITDVGGYRYHTFDLGGDEEFEIIANDDGVPVEIAVIPAGGAGGGLRGGGGGGGKVKKFAAAGTVGVHPIVVGEAADSSDGGDSSAFGVTGKGGGKGGTSSAGNPGGNGGGGSGPGNNGGASTDSGHTGGRGAVEDGGGSDDGGGGGAGDGGDGNPADYFFGDGGPGTLVWGQYYGPGGGGNQDLQSGNGGIGGGGHGGAGGNPSTQGEDGKGAGAGGGEGKRGGHGRVVVRYPLAV